MPPDLPPQGLRHSPQPKKRFFHSQRKAGGPHDLDPAYPLGRLLQWMRRLCRVLSPRSHHDSIRGKVDCTQKSRVKSLFSAVPREASAVEAWVEVRHPSRSDRKHTLFFSGRRRNSFPWNVPEAPGRGLRVRTQSTHRFYTEGKWL